MMLTVVSGAFPFVAEAKEQTVDIDGIVYEFGKKSEYEISVSETIIVDTKADFIVAFIGIVEIELTSSISVLL